MIIKSYEYDFSYNTYLYYIYRLDYTIYNIKIHIYVNFEICIEKISHQNFVINDLIFLLQQIYKC